MQIALTRTHNANRILRQRHKREVYVSHIRKAQFIRDAAERLIEEAGPLLNIRQIEQIRNDAEFTAIEIENCKCMERH